MDPFVIFLVILAAVALIMGYHVGVVKQIGSLAGILLGIAFCRVFAGSMASSFSAGYESLSNKIFIVVLTYAGVFTIGYFIAWFASVFAKKLIGTIHLGMIDSVAGSVFMLFLWIFLLSIALNLWAAAFMRQFPEGSVISAVANIAPAMLGQQSTAEMSAAANSAAALVP